MPTAEIDDAQDPPTEADDEKVEEKVKEIESNFKEFKFLPMSRISGKMNNNFYTYDIVTIF